MNAPFPFESLLIFSWLGIMLIAGVILRATIPFLQKYLIPSCLIGGLIGMVLVNCGVINIESTHFETFAYHLFNISFISVGLTARSSEEIKQTGNKEMLKGSLWMALLQGVIFPLQAVLSGLMVLAFNVGGYNLFSTFGFLLPLGYVQGPGQALSIGKVWEKLGFENAASIGLTFAAVGFLVAFFVGVPIVNWGIRHGHASDGRKLLSPDFIKGIIAKGNARESAGELSTHSGNVDTLAFQAAMVGVIYIAAYYIVFLIGKLLSPALATTLWGFFFFIGLALALLTRKILSVIGIDHLVNPGVQRRITGWSVDFLIVATVMAVKFTIVWQYIVPISAIAAANALVTTIVVLFLGRRIWSYNLERTVSIFGTVTGTVSTGLLLLRIVDPEFKTSVALEMGFLIIFVSPIIITCMLLVSAPLLWGWSMMLTMGVFTGMMIFFGIAMYALGMVGKRKF